MKQYFLEILTKGQWLGAEQIYYVVVYAFTQVGCYTNVWLSMLTALFIVTEVTTHATGYGSIYILSDLFEGVDKCKREVWKLDDQSIHFP